MSGCRIYTLTFCVLSSKAHDGRAWASASPSTIGVRGVSTTAAGVRGCFVRVRMAMFHACGYGNVSCVSVRMAMFHACGPRFHDAMHASFVELKLQYSQLNVQLNKPVSILSIEQCGAGALYFRRGFSLCVAHCCSLPHCCRTSFGCRKQTAPSNRHPTVRPPKAPTLPPWATTKVFRNLNFGNRNWWNHRMRERKQPTTRKMQLSSRMHLQRALPKSRERTKSDQRSACQTPHK